MIVKKLCAQAHWDAAETFDSSQITTLAPSRPAISNLALFGTMKGGPSA